MSAWMPVPPEYGDVWNRFDTQFRFRASHEAKGHGILEPAPSITFDIHAKIGVALPDEEYAAVNDLHTKAHLAFQHVTPVGNRLIVLDWQHDEYLFDPHAPLDAANWREWKTWVYPDGDYYAFLADDFSYGTFGHPWAGTICVWGQELIDAFAVNPPLLFGSPIRKNGVKISC